MDEVKTLVVDKYDGSLKAEHRNPDGTWLHSSNTNGEKGPMDS